MNEQELIAWVTEQKQADEPAKQAWQREIGVDMNYYEGYGWAQITPFSSNEIERLKVDLNPDSPEFRATLNRTTPLVQRAAATTHPTTITVRGKPPERNMGPLGTVRAQLHEDLANLCISESGLVESWQNANFMRHVIGCYGVGISLRPGMRKLTAMGQTVDAPSSSLHTFDFLPLRLVLDPGVQERNLSRHEWIIYEDAWSYQKTMRLLGKMLDDRKITIQENELSTMGDLSSFELTLNTLTYNRLFPQYRAHSKTKGVMVTQVHRKDGSGRFGTMEILVQIKPGVMVLLNPDNRESPFGGNGLPIRLIHGHRRSDSLQSIGDTRMCKDDQDRLNRTQTSVDRQLIHSSKHQWVVDKAWFDTKNPKEISKRINNAVAGLILGNGGTKENPIAPPQLVNIPPPQPALREMIAGYEDAMRSQAHRSASNFGELLSHVPDRSYQRGLDEAGAVFDTWVNEDKATMESLIGVLEGTAVRLVRDRDPGMLGTLDRDGFTGDEMLTLSREDPNYAGCDLSISDGSIRMRSWNARKQDLDGAAQRQMIDQKTYRRELATALDAPLVQDDKLFATAFDKLAAGLLTGETAFEPMPLGPERSSDLLAAMERALVCPDAMADPMARQRVAGAIQSQRMLMAQMAAQEQMAGVQGEGASAQQGADSSGDLPDEGSFSALIDQMSRQAAA